MRRREGGFTLIEFLITTALLGMLVSVVIVAVDPAGRLQQSRDANRISDIKQLHTALEAYYTVNNAYPQMTEAFSGWERSECNDLSCGDGSAAPFIEELVPKFSQTSFSDPIRGNLPLGAQDWGYLYQTTLNGGSYCLLTHLEESDNELKIQDGSCDDGFDDESSSDVAWWYAIDSLVK